LSKAKDKSLGLTARELRRRFEYNQHTGEFRYRYTPECQTKVKAGDVAGYIREKRYWVISIDNKKYYAHRLAWLYFYGVWPDRLIDHRDTNKLNNSINNLRLSTQAENKTNGSLYENNTSGFKGVTKYRCKHIQKGLECSCPPRWKAQATIDQKVVYLGLFDTKEQAHEAYVKAVQAARPTFARPA
jgi:hypothetical protein